MLIQEELQHPIIQAALAKITFLEDFGGLIGRSVQSWAYGEDEIQIICADGNCLLIVKARPGWSEDATIEFGDAGDLRLFDLVNFEFITGEEEEEVKRDVKERYKEYRRQKDLDTYWELKKRLFSGKEK